MSAQLPPGRRYVTLSAGAEYLSVTVPGLRKFIAEGRITGYRLGKRAIRVDVRELDALLTPIPTARTLYDTTVEQARESLKNFPAYPTKDEDDDPEPEVPASR